MIYIVNKIKYENGIKYMQNVGVPLCTHYVPYIYKCSMIWDDVYHGWDYRLEPTYFFTR